MINGSATCSAASLTPSFSSAFELAALQTQLQAQLPNELVDLPGILLFITIATAVNLALTVPVVLARSIPRIKGGHFPIYVPLLNKLAIGSLVVVFVFGLTGAIGLWFPTRVLKPRESLRMLSDSAR